MMDREHGAREAAAFVRRLDFPRERRPRSTRRSREGAHERRRGPARVPPLA